MKINCNEMGGMDCNHEVEGETPAEVKEKNVGTC